jgi:hypothetical protein
MATAKGGKKITGILSFVFIWLISVGLMVSLIPNQEAWAGKKKISGTATLAIHLNRSMLAISGKTPVRVTSRLYVLNSTDPAWDNASYFHVSVAIDPPGFGDDFSTYAVITHPGGDQTFIESEGSWKYVYEGEYEWSSESKGQFVGGTGKFEEIKALWKFKGKAKKGDSEIIGEWEVEYQ